MKDKIVIKGARAHNLKNVDLTIPRDQLVVFTGVSGSGKSSLAFDTKTLCGVALLLCKAVFGADGKAGCRPHRGAFSCHLH